MYTQNEQNGSASVFVSDKADPSCPQGRQGIAVSDPSEIQKFKVDAKDVLIALSFYLIGFLYIDGYLDGEPVAEQILFLFLAAGAVEYVFRHGKRSAESWVWLGCLALVSAGRILQNEAVWKSGQLDLFQHIFFVWWTLSRSGKLLDGKSGRFLAADAFNGFVLIPFSHFGMRIRTFVYAVRQRTRGTKERKKRSPLIVPAAMICLYLFISAVHLLGSADGNFGAWLDGFGTIAWPDLRVFILKLLLSLPVGAWLHGLVRGLDRTEETAIAEQKTNLLRFLDSLRAIPSGMWIGAISVFSLLYVTFFVFQANYLFSAFRGSLPSDFSVAEYARQGFFELCKITCVNFALLWLASRTTEEGSASARNVRILSSVLLSENVIFCAIAFSKLYLYIGTFGFTPKRLESTWLVCVIFAGCAAWLYHLCTDRPVFRKWMIFGAVTLSALCLI